MSTPGAGGVIPRVGVDLGHLSGAEVDTVARTLVTGQLDLLLSRKDEIVKLNTDELRRLAELGVATRANCGGFGCG
jgi:hypothetical protein